MWRLKQLEPLLVLESPFKDLGGFSNKAGKDHVRWKISGYKFTFAWLWLLLVKVAKQEHPEPLPERLGMC